MTGFCKQHVRQALDHLLSFRPMAWNPETAEKLYAAITELRAALAQLEPAAPTYTEQDCIEAEKKWSAPAAPTNDGLLEAAGYVKREAAPTVVGPDVPEPSCGNIEPVAWIYKPNRELLWPSELEVINPIGIDEYLPLYSAPPRAALRADAERPVFYGYCAVLVSEDGKVWRASRPTKRREVADACMRDWSRYAVALQAEVRALYEIQHRGHQE